MALIKPCNNIGPITIIECDKGWPFGGLLQLSGDYIYKVSVAIALFPVKIIHPTPIKTIHPRIILPISASFVR